MKTEPTLILSEEDIDIKIKRISLQILEACINEESIVVAGIEKNGFKMAESILKNLNKLSEQSIILTKVKINKKNPLNSVEVSLTPTEYKNKSVILIDDVLNTGSTLMFAAKHFLDVPLKQFKTAVLVDRNHKKYPIKVDFKGISLSTSLNESVKVDFNAPAKAELI
ncbi:phosphoribosyltransferase family protein [Psychroflexus lacisalsi]|jgi:pyrimidine operon attenuation protein/uracil phosphoribosyltransferase|uniref:Phosphoribosyltransferase domain-containing protein n=1 Tax=Psychroflexus lacisalsi TaxID=503928 RepID=A0ABP3VIJ2_9FLAO|nr:phosphoribosyltransferase family protein [Psychroflexus lacisalsi]MBZ9619250.1 phosphoribosyltransferase [Psychroflexus lacisalsi]